MKTIILASKSEFLENHNIDRFLPKKLVDCKIAYITTAAQKVRRKEYLFGRIKAMNNANLDLEEIDIAQKSEIQLRESFKDCDIIMVEGGNAFYLIKSVFKSGFDKVIKDLIIKGVVYMGFSAGSYIASPSIVVSTWNKAHASLKYRCGLVNFTALNLIPFFIKAHYVPEMQSVLRDKYGKLQHPLKVITDDQAIVVRDNKIEFIGNGEEIII